MALLPALSIFLLAHLPSIETMSTEEKVGQTLMVHFQGEDANSDAKTLIHDVHVGSIIYYNWANGLTSPQQVQKLSISLQNIAKKSSTAIPLFIAADQEGGVVARLSQGFTEFPGNRALGEANDEALVEESAFAMGNEMKAVGVNLNLAPVVDIASNPSSYIGIRSLADSAEKVSELAQKLLQGYRRAGVITAIKHFPGYGDVCIDPHQDLPILKKSQDELRKCELVPYYKLSSSADMIMTAHISTPAFDAKNCATLSPIILNDLLRKEIGYKGIVISDSLVMEGLLKNCPSIEEAAIQSFNAGSDILILGGKQLIGPNKNLELTVSDVQKIFQSMVASVKSGRISEERLNDSVKRILQVKASYELNSFVDEETIEKSVATQEHKKLAEKIATIATVQSKPPVSIQGKKLLVIAPTLVRDSLKAAKIPNECYAFFFYNSLTPSIAEKNRALELAQDAEVVIALSYNAWENPEQIELITALIESEKPVNVVCLRDPQDADLFSKASGVIKTHSPTTPSIQVALNLLQK